ncbi:beta-ketoacyl-ACP synthase [Microseira wollei]|uniref:3-oxoacyl-(Acyl carrier protein) synthase II n=2 Tax=Microseira wollei TaxID=467598 RepID=A0AAV3X7V3_9CYAN|nr:3-oxoacyl-(acyl carrier protein) synthase II [Microseira wollei NIES-4236]
MISALGRLDSSWKNLLASKSAIKVHQPFPELEALPLALIDRKPTNLKILVDLVVKDALQDAGLVPPLPDCGVAIGSSRSQQASWEKLAIASYLEDAEYPHTRSQAQPGNQSIASYLQDALHPDSRSQADPGNQSIASYLEDAEHPHTRSQAEPGNESNKALPWLLQDWLETLPHMGAIAAARQIGSTAPVLAPMAACATGIWALAQGFELIQTGQCQRVIAGAVEAPITPLTLAGFEQMGALAKTGCYPFDRYREGLVLGEGAAVFVLESAELANRRGASIYGEILGFGLTADAYHISAPEPGGRSAIAAVKQCLERSHLSFGDIDYIHTHGTSTQLNDQNEANLIRYLFPQGVPVSSTKGSTGHTLGASGALGVAFCLMGLKYQILPPCVGLNEPEFDLDLVKVPRRGNIRQILCFSFGFGGQNAVIALG